MKPCPDWPFPGYRPEDAGLLGVGTLQQESRGASIPEISTKEQALCFVELEYRESG